ncbi:hypothetical protein ISN45_Aa07g009350 [Arabidopsis thaliana x Arabidopsis arenosa]|uniref:Uncharacterized protein n=1 Tax=Arabidopsis thaliana x Arabidopsis arenosa TaxID=1240361 RepID=A0A8T1YAZ1_9BRAS|nr:hypothetical protein ISN45_Aa07g009350 [Arabidopsis thaliana x Arabidopsis arenosa]
MYPSSLQYVTLLCLRHTLKRSNKLKVNPYMAYVFVPASAPYDNEFDDPSLYTWTSTTTSC